MRRKETLYMESMEPCPDCDAVPGQPHDRNCAVEICSVCGKQRSGCDCKGHDKAFARWTGLWPGKAEAEMLGLDLNGLYNSGYYKYFFIKPVIEKTNER